MAKPDDTIAIMAGWAEHQREAAMRMSHTSMALIMEKAGLDEVRVTQNDMLTAAAAAVCIEQTQDGGFVVTLKKRGQG